MISSKTDYIHLNLANALQMNTDIGDGKWILLICVTAKPERKATAQWLGDAGIEGKEEASKVGLTLGKKLVCACFPYL